MKEGQMKRLAVSVLAVISCFGIGCGKETPATAEARSFYREMILQTNECADKLVQVKDSKAAAETLNTYIEAQKKLIEKGRELRMKYPKINLHEDPALKEYEQALEEASKSMTAAVTDAMKKYLAKEEFRKALDRFDEIAGEAEK